MNEFIKAWKDPSFLKYMMIFGAIIFAINLIRLIVVISKVKRAETYLYQMAEAFDGLSMGCGIIALFSFIQKMTIISIMSTILAIIFFCCDRKFTWLRHNASATQEVQSMLDGASKNSIL